MYFFISPSPPFFKCLSPREGRTESQQRVLGQGLCRDEIFQGQLGVRGAEVEAHLATARPPWGHRCTCTGKTPLSGQRLGLPGKPHLPGWLGFAAS